MGDRLPVMTDMDDYTSLGASSDTENPVDYQSMSSPTVACPTCSGSGRIPKEHENQLVAIIPINDKRLRPSRTMYWVLIAILVCIIVSSLLLFFLLPRSVVVEVEIPILVPTSVRYVGDEIEEGRQEILIDLPVKANVTNNNYYAVSVVNVTVEVFTPPEYSMGTPVQLIGTGSNVTSAQLGINRQMELSANTTIKVALQDRLQQLYYTCYYISLAHINLEITLTVHYMGHTEQSSFQANKRICCGRSGSSNVTDYCHYTPGQMAGKEQGLARYLP